MKSLLQRLARWSAAIRLSIARHGGGATGLLTVATRAVKVIRALGVRGFWQRVALATRKPSPITTRLATHRFAAPSPLSEVRLRVGIMAHVFYTDLLDEFATALENMPLPFDLLVSVMDATAAEQARHGLTGISKLHTLHIRVVPNRGRDIAPLLVAFREEILALDLVCHIHTKKSLYTGSEQSSWRQYLVNSLLGSSERIGWLLGMFQAEPRLGIIYPESHESVPLWAHTWLSNFSACNALAMQLGFSISQNQYIDFPAGSMFWARVDALRPLYELNLRLEDFPPEEGQIDGTLHHAMERMFVAVARQSGFVAGVLPADGGLALSTEGARNWHSALSTPLSTRLTLSALEAELISLDVFDTLVTRPFLTPEAARNYLANKVERTFGLSGFHALRELAEARARVRLGHDVDISAIYEDLAALSEAAAPIRQALLEYEIAFEQSLLRPRRGMIEAAAAGQARGKRLIAISDMYLDHVTLKKILPNEVTALPGNWYVSCETHLRKDDGGIWEWVSTQEAVEKARWLHVGDNELSDIQRPQLHRLLTPVHVIRPSALLDIVPSLRPLRPADGPQARWQDQLWLGLLANHFADIADTAPEQLLPKPVLSEFSFGYAVIGPLVLDYLAWLTRTALAQGHQHLLFLSREGYLLEKAFAVLKGVSPALAQLSGHYFLASRRGTGTPSLHVASDLRSLLGSTYVGNLHGLVRARLGEAAGDVVEAHLDMEALKQDIYLPEMQDATMEMLAPATAALLKLAAEERGHYLDYWHSVVGSGSALVADIGYAGTIQANLARMTGETVNGAYFALNAGANRLADNSLASARYFDGRHGEDADSSAILRHDLLLETLLTAPTAQFSHFTAGEHAPTAVYLQTESTPSYWNCIEKVHAGALAFVNAVCSITGDESHLLSLDRTLVQQPLICVGTGEWSAPWLADLAVADQFTGRGLVSASALA
ncbi:rhamnan synthesis F family protein [Xanthomonas maliensis]|uniref:rhamnan synthesis F family protein n=2 Tax=Xanthomonas maliensis TaxID=1321368 RepID=UPI001264815F|nr:rhamnan synthesis F family protein [Xanthomonas maliensis]KAB7765798.1 polysaccharide biosynthesis protein [Xanthomonas maliensis]